MGYNHIANINPEEILCLSSVMILDLRDNKIARCVIKIFKISTSSPGPFAEGGGGGGAKWP